MLVVGVKVLVRVEVTVAPLRVLLVTLSCSNKSTSIMDADGYIHPVYSYMCSCDARQQPKTRKIT